MIGLSASADCSQYPLIKAPFRLTGIASESPPRLMLLKSIIHSANMGVKMTTIDDRKFLVMLGDKVRRQRITRRMTQAELARRCELHRTFIGSVERGERNISVLNLRLIAKMLRVPLAALLSSD